MNDIKIIEKQLDDQQLEKRLQALKQIKELIDDQQVEIKDPNPSLINLHCHTIYSYNAYGYSPCHVAWLALKNGLSMTGMVDFDVIDGMNEFRQATDILGVRGVVGLESRVFIPEYSDKEINSPNEPGVAYYTGIGFTSNPQPGSNAEKILNKVRNISEQRNREIFSKLVPHLSSLKMDYDRDIMSLTPSGNATERHILFALYRKSQEIFDQEDKRAEFWAEKIDHSKEEVLALFQDEYKLFELMRKKLVKIGGVGYIEPDPQSFPQVDEVRAMINEMNALACPAYLDGTSEGESDIYALMKLHHDKGDQVAAIIPDRNWNISDPDKKKILIANLDKMIQACRELGMHVIAGTELNKLGQKIVDDLDVPELAPYKDDFMKGAEFVYAHAEKNK